VRLERLGFDSFDYAAGKQDWLACGLPYEGSADLVARHIDSDVATCRLGRDRRYARRRLGALRTRLQ